MPIAKKRRSAPRKHLVLRLREGWSYDPRRRRFNSAGRVPFAPGKDLPKYTRIMLQVPLMAAKAKRSPAEDELARGVQIVPPGNPPLAKLLQRVQSWPCVEKAWVSPEVMPAAHIPAAGTVSPAKTRRATTARRTR